MFSHVPSQRISLATLASAAYLVTIALFGTPSAAGEINTGYFGGAVIKGYDAVAYFTQGRAVKGSEDHSYEWLKGDWYFATAEHREMFVSNPVKYAPQLGGRCSTGVALGEISTNIDPQAFRIIDGKLYLHYDQNSAYGFEEVPGDVASAEDNWPELRAALISQR